MRQIFNSQRVETVEGVAQLLRDAGIEVRITNGRSYHSKRGSQFSYLDKEKATTHPTLWVVHADDQPRAVQAGWGSTRLGSPRARMAGRQPACRCRMFCPRSSNSGAGRPCQSRHPRNVRLPGAWQGPCERPPARSLKPLPAVL